MNAQAKERKKKEETLVININLTRGGVALLAGTLLIITLFGYLAWRPQVVHAQSEALAPNSAPLASAGTGYISVPASAFRPQWDGLDYKNPGSYLKMDAGFGTFTAPLQLPHGATVISMTIHFDDSDGGDSGFAGIVRTEFNEPLKMAEVVFADGNGSKSDTSIDYAVIDNSQYSYYLSAYLHDTSISLHEVLIKFAYRDHFPWSLFVPAMIYNGGEAR